MNTMSKKSLKLAGALAIALGTASPLMATSASAAPYGHGSYQHHETYRSHGKYDAMRDRNHRPHALHERHGHAPHAHMKWRDGRWNWSRGHWVWAPGIWIRF
jgi:hypothetical protein